MYVIRAVTILLNYYSYSQCDLLHFGQVSKHSYALDYGLVVLVDDRLDGVRVHVDEGVVEPYFARL